jgi:4-hydroxy-3-methylbut-2-enyl diphosphate reductase
MTKEIILASPRGFCAGVQRAIDMVNLAIEKYQTNIYVNHAIVHNKFVVENFENQGVIFTKNLDEIPRDSVYIFSAHGVSPKFREQVKAKNLKIIDATCPLVSKVHWEADKYSKEDFVLFYIGQANHQEYLGVAGVTELILLQNKTDVENLKTADFINKKTMCLTQTTLSIEDTAETIQALKQKFPKIRIPGDICYATTNRQDAIKELAKKSDFIVVIGSKNSSNSNKLVYTAQKYGCDAQLFDNLAEIPAKIFTYNKIGISSGASVPEKLVKEVIKGFKQKSPQAKISLLETKKEEFSFPLGEI